jgi:hypothetical protein
MKKRWGAYNNPNKVVITTPITKDNSAFAFASATPEENPPTPLDGTAHYIGEMRKRYEYAGKPTNEQDWDKATREWISQDLDAIGETVLDQLSSEVKFSWEKARRSKEWEYIPYPASWLKQQPWTRRQAVNQ